VLFRKRKLISSVCSKTRRFLKHNSKCPWLIWLFPILGLASLIWFLIRVLPKPSRATYPCQRVAFPLAAGFIIWLLGLGGSTVAFHKARSSFSRSRYLIGFLCIMAGIGCLWLTLTFTAQKQVKAADPHPVNDAIGVARGINPGRVVWVHDPNATDWEGPGRGDGYWWQSNNTDQDAVDKMMSMAIQAVAGQLNEEAAWDAIFRYFNQSRGRENAGYQSGEKITIKINMSAVQQVDAAGNQRAHLEWVNTSPQMIVALLRQLVNVVGVAESDITVVDTTQFFPNHYWDYCHAEFPYVHYLAKKGNLSRRDPVSSIGKDCEVPFFWSTSDANGKRQDYLPVSYAEATYLINFACLKGHSSGITLCAKNHYGSFIRLPPATGYYNLHLSLPNQGWSPGTGQYRTHVDITGHPHLGGKTLLNLIDGLYGGYYWEGMPFKWYMEPFGGDWPSSLFASQDPVAIDSVGYDFLLQEWPDVVSGGVGAPGSLEGGAEDHLHEAALANNPPSGTFYDPNNDGLGLASLGVHEHWNNPVDKQYSRNLGIGEGIELLLPVPADFNGDGKKASTPNPADGATIGPETPILSWNPGHEAIEHDVFFGTNFDDVNNVDLLDDTGIYRGRWIDPAYAAEDLDLDKTYYWRIDEVEPDGTTIHKGDVWSFTVSSMIPVEDFETGNFSKFSWQHPGNSNWTISQQEKHSGAYSAWAGEINDEQSSTLRLNLECVSGNITFYRKVSSERDCDFLNFYIDGIRQDKWSGEKDWAQVSFPVEEGTRIFEWTYSKDSSISSGSDTAWIDDIVFPIE